MFQEVDRGVSQTEWQLGREQNSEKDQEVAEIGGILDFLTAPGAWQKLWQGQGHITQQHLTFRGKFS